MNTIARKLIRTSLLALTLTAGTGTMIAPHVAQAAPKSGNMMATAHKGNSMMAAPLTGTFKQVTHATKGTATVKGHTLTLSNFETGMGPKLHVYLVSGKADSNAAVKAAVASKKYVDLGTLRSIKGTQSYTLPASAKAKSSSVVIWCDKFDVVFGSAKLV